MISKRTISLKATGKSLHCDVKHFGNYTHVCTVTRVWREYFFVCIIVRTICTPGQLFLVCLLGTVQGEEVLICHHCLLADRLLGSRLLLIASA